jgi:hypothetical protein
VREGDSGNFEGGDGWGEGPDSPEGRFGPWISLDAPRRPGPDVSAECPRLPGRGVRGRSEDSGPVLGPASAWRRRGRGTVAAGPTAAARQRPPLGGLGPVLGQEPSTLHEGGVGAPLRWTDSESESPTRKSPLRWSRTDALQLMKLCFTGSSSNAKEAVQCLAESRPEVSGPMHHKANGSHRLLGEWSILRSKPHAT